MPRTGHPREARPRASDRPGGVTGSWKSPERIPGRGWRRAPGASVLDALEELCFRKNEASVVPGAVGALYIRMAPEPERCSGCAPPCGEVWHGSDGQGERAAKLRERTQPRGGRGAKNRA